LSLALAQDLKREIMQRFALLPWGDENWVPSARWRVRAGAGWGFAVVRVAVAGAEDIRCC
jgi:hypothetical protein